MNDPFSTLTTMINGLLEPVRDFLSKIVGPPSAELGGLLADRVRFSRFKQSLNIMEKAKKILYDRGVGLRQVSLKTLVPILEIGSLEEDDGMQSRWAALLANAADASYKTIIPPSFPEILKQLSPQDAMVLDKMFDHEVETVSAPFERIPSFGGGISAGYLESVLGIQLVEVNFILDNLLRLGLCASPSGAEGEPVYSGRNFHPNYFEIYLTTIGTTFVKACRVTSTSGKLSS